MYAVSAALFEPNGRKICDAVRRDIVRRIADLIKQLLGNARDGYTAAGAAMLCHDERAVRFGFDNAARPNLMSADGLPVNLFRTDDWPVDTEAVKK